jgi:hypothetical protein
MATPISNRDQFTGYRRTETDVIFVSSALVQQQSGNEHQQKKRSIDDYSRGSNPNQRNGSPLLGPRACNADGFVKIVKSVSDNLHGHNFAYNSQCE